MFYNHVTVCFDAYLYTVGDGIVRRVKNGVFFFSNVRHMEQQSLEWGWGGSQKHWVHPYDVGVLLSVYFTTWSSFDDTMVDIYRLLKNINYLVHTSPCQ